ncbi:hypothetical protein CIB84_002051 [Bambusicola thoracicus]|uniref:Uncharacterized protein n=1 Tax=Bambusicola thoracicus TaxID=9083 RepID=A0A2P4TCV5_BAMTH|nr:hypothetical protein CIB84_002051 [Bambusicola thoracicus]
MAEILVTTILTNFEQLQTRRTASDFHYVTLVVGDADNQVIFIQKIMDSVLLKTGNWMKKIEVKRALKSDDISINLISSDYGSRSKEENIHKKYSNRECNHRCKNKDVCGHDCCEFHYICKTGVLSKSEMSGDSKFSLYLADLRSRNSTSSVPPVKRLKMQMLNQAQSVDLKQFVFEPKSLMPASSRY